MAYDYSKLAGKIVEVFGTQGKFAEAMGISEHTISQKMSNKVHFKQPDITKACSLLGIADADIPAYFFTLQVQNH